MPSIRPGNCCFDSEVLRSKRCLCLRAHRAMPQIPVAARDPSGHISRGSLSMDRHRCLKAIMPSSKYPPFNQDRDKTCSREKIAPWPWFFSLITQNREMLLSAGASATIGNEFTAYTCLVKETLQGLY